MRIPNREILNHPWMISDPNAMLKSPHETLDENEINPLIVDQVIRLGFPKALILKTMKDIKALNQITVSYYLVLINFS